MFRKLFRKLFPNKTKIDFPGGFIPNKFILDRIDNGPVLVIGDYNGRDFLPLKKKFNETYLLDVSDNNLASGKYFVKQSITSKTPFPDGYFKYVVLTNVIEHVWEDLKTMKEINRILDDDGGLLFCVPLYNDFHDRHFHIYSPKTVKLLFDYSGYEIEESQYMKTITSIPPEIVALLAIITYPIFGQNSLKKVNKFLYNIHTSISDSFFINKFLKFRFKKKALSILIFAKKSNSKKDPIKTQIEGYEKK